MKFVIFGTKITVSFLFLATVTVIFLIDKSGLLTPMAIAIVMHETAHLVSMQLLGCQPKEINLIPGGIEIVRSFSLKKNNEIIISFSGPFINILLFLIFFRYNLEFSLINLCIGIFNLLPLSFLDGGEILKIILTEIFGLEKAKKFLGLLNFLIGLLGIILGVFLIFNKTLNVTLMIFSIYLILSVIIKF